MITVWGWPTTLAFYYVQGKDAMATQFKQDTAISMEYTSYEYANYNPALKTALPAGSGPDAVITDWDAVGTLWSFMLPLEDRLKIDFSGNWRDKFVQSALDEIDLVDPKHVLYLPGDMELLGWPFYWMDDFRKADMSAADLKKWNDFEAACEKLKKAGLQPLVGSANKAANWQYIDWFQSLTEVTAPGKIEHVQRGSGKFTDKDIVDAFALLRKVFTQYMQPGVLGADVATGVDEFQKHHASMTMVATGTPWFGFLTSKNDDVRKGIESQWSTFVVPGSKGLVATDAYVSIVKTSKNPDAAWEFAKWLTLGHGAEVVVKASNQPMAAKGFALPKTGKPFDQNLEEPLFNAIQDPKANKFRRILSQDVYQSLSDTIPGVISGQLTPEDAAKQTQQVLEQSFQGDGKRWYNPGG